MKKKIKKQKSYRKQDEDLGRIHKVKSHTRNEKYRHPKHWMEEEEISLDSRLQKFSRSEEE
jgi:hypothetical protein